MLFSLIIAIFVIAFVLGVAKWIFKSAGEIVFIMILVVMAYGGWQYFHYDIKNGASNLTHELAKSGERALDTMVKTGKNKVNGVINE